MDVERYLPSDFQGCLSVRQNGRHLIQKSYGYSDRSNQIPNKTTTRFAGASVGKVFVACAILALVQDERLNLDAAIGELLDLDFRDIDPQITVRHLLTHTSGMPDYFDEDTMEDYAELWQDFPNYRVRTSSDLLPLFLHKPMLFPKGERFHYNNAGFVVLGLIIERITGLLFDDYLAERVFAPAGMTSTGYFELDRLPRDCANSYIYDTGRREYYTNIYSVDAKGTGAGGVFTTAGDMDRFWDALLGFKLLSPPLTRAMLSCQCAVDEGDDYGFGLWLKKEPGSGHTPYVQGSDPGVSFVSACLSSPRTIITIMSNAGQNVWEILRGIR